MAKSQKSTSAGKVSFELALNAPSKWTHETPSLYTLLLTLKDHSGTVVEVIPKKVGFRQVEIRGNVFM
jgi:beta-galactosidase/beta-glucuronidase